MRAIARVGNAAANAAADTSAARAAIRATDAANAAANAAAHAATTASNTSDTVVASAAALAADAEFSDDATALEHGVASSRLARHPLWSAEAPDWASSAWSSFSFELFAADEGWEVWTDWYEARLRGASVNCALEVARVTELTEKEWKAAPAEVNARLKEIEARFAKEPPPSREEVEDALAPSPVGITWRWDGERYAKEHRAEDTDAAAAQASMTRQLHAAARRAAGELSARGSTKANYVEWAGVLNAVNQLDGALGATPEHTAERTGELWDAVAALEAQLRADAERKAGAASHGEPLAPEERALLEQVCNAGQGLSVQFPSVRELEARLAEREPPPAEEVDAAERVAQSASDAGVIEQSDGEYLGSALAAGNGDDHRAKQAARRGTHSVRNLAGAVMFGFFLSTLGGTHSGEAVTQFLRTCEEAITQLYRSTSETTQSVVRRLLEEARKASGGME